MSPGKRQRIHWLHRDQLSTCRCRALPWVLGMMQCGRHGAISPVLIPHKFLLCQSPSFQPPTLAGNASYSLPLLSLQLGHRQVTKILVDGIRGEVFREQGVDLRNIPHLGRERPCLFQLDVVTEGQIRGHRLTC